MVVVSPLPSAFGVVRVCASPTTMTWLATGFGSAAASGSRATAPASLGAPSPSARSSAQRAHRTHVPPEVEDEPEPVREQGLDHFRNLLHRDSLRKRRNDVESRRSQGHHPIRSDDPVRRETESIPDQIGEGSALNIDAAWIDLEPQWASNASPPHPAASASGRPADNRFHRGDLEFRRGCGLGGRLVLGLEGRRTHDASYDRRCKSGHRAVARALRTSAAAEYGWTCPPSAAPASILSRDSTQQGREYRGLRQNCRHV